MVATVLMRTRRARVLTLAATVVSALAASAAAQAPHGGAATHVVIVSIDGLMPDYYLPGAGRSVRTPALDALRERGSWAEGVIGQYPSLTYPSHTSVATGVALARHGVFGNTRFEREGGETGWYFDSGALRVPAIWDAARAAGLTTAALSWPVTVGAKIDYLIPETNQAPADTTWLDLARRQSTPGLVDEVVARLGGFDGKDPRSYDERDRFMTAAAALVIERHRPNLLMLHLVEADGAQHASGPGSPEARAAIERVDSRIGEVVAAIGRAGIAGQTAVLVTGDHGFYRVHSAFRPNAALREAGLLETDASGRITSWRAIAHRSAIKLKDPVDEATARKVEAVFTGLAEGRYRGLFRAIGRDEIRRLGGDPEALLIIEPIEGFTTQASAEGPFLVSSPRRGDHGYLPTSPRMHTGLIASGAGIRPGIAMPIARQVDIAPTAARLLGVELPDVDGVPLVGMLADRPAAPRRTAASRR
jgi:predicted AlkP superfamily pyrophosphatase or phosphodiesterase